MRKQILIAALLATTAAGAQAETVAALTGERTIVLVDTGAAKVTGSWDVKGITGKVLGIDVRPADGLLYALVDDGSVVIVDTATGAATAKSKLDGMLPAGVIATVDFNPVADRLRVIGSDGTNLRANVDDGKVTRDGNLNYAGGDGMKEARPNVVAGAYTNSFKGAKDTALYDIDVSGALLKQAPPNDGVLNPVGKLGMPGKGAAFDIAADGNGGNAAWLLVGDELYSVDLATGKGTPAAKISGIGGTVRDMAILPAKAM